MIGPGLTAAVALVAFAPWGVRPALPVMVPLACAAASAANRLPTNRDRALVLWLFAVSSVLGAVGTGLMALAASMVVVMCALLAPAPERFTISRHDVVVPDDISGL